MIDSELSWKHHNDFVCDKISRSVGIIVKMRHCIPWHLLLNLYLALIVPYLNYGICVHRPTSIRYLSPRNIFFIESNCFPLQSLFFQQLSHLMYDVHAKTAPKSLLDTFAKVNTKHRARSIQPNLPEISVQNSMDRFGPTGKVSKKRVHLLRWSSFPGRTGWNFG